MPSMARLVILTFSMFLFAACPFFENPSSLFGDGNQNQVTHQERDVTGTLSLAMGGVAEDADDLIVDGGFQVLDLRNEDPDLFSLDVRDGYANYADGQGGEVAPRNVGIGYVTPIVSGRTVSPYEITIPPQKLIQILIGEARGELNREATLDGGDVKPSSVSVTGDAIGAVIRNRIHLITETNNPSLFVADATSFERDPPLSYYEAVIEANNGTVYQFSPVAPADPGHSYFEAAEFRSALRGLDSESLVAYDQAVLTAAGIFNDRTEDLTGGAFGFYSPTTQEFESLKEALDNQVRELPVDGGISDARFPALAPLQILILEGIAPSFSDSDVPSFVFVRTRTSVDAAVTNEI